MCNSALFILGLQQGGRWERQTWVALWRKLETFLNTAPCYVIVHEWRSVLSHRGPSVGWTRASRSSWWETVCCSLFELGSHFSMVTKRAISDLLFWHGPPSFFCLLAANFLIGVFQETSITLPDRVGLLSSKRTWGPDTVFGKICSSILEGFQRAGYPGKTPQDR